MYQIFSNALIGGVIGWLGSELFLFPPVDDWKVLVALVALLLSIIFSFVGMAVDC